MLDKLVFYNSWGAGDIFESREFVKDYMKLFPAKEYYYAHGKHPRILADIPELRYTAVEDFMNCRMPFFTKGNSLFVNTWIGRTSKYVLPGSGCVVERLFDMHNEYLHAIDNKHLLRTVYEYIPSIDYSYYNVERINKFVEPLKNIRLVLIDSGKVQSKQAENFDFTPVIEKLASTFTDIIFITTHKINNSYLNLMDTDTIIQSEDKFDLNEIAYLSGFCDTIIGRCSGPQVFAQNLDNWLDKNKILLSFTYTPYSASFVLDNRNLFMKKVWSGSTKTDDVFKDCYNVIKRSF